MSNARSSRSAASGGNQRSSTAQPTFSVSAQRPTAEQSEQTEHRNPVPEMHVTFPSNAVESGSVFQATRGGIQYDSTRIDRVMDGFVDYESQVNALRHRLGAVVREVQDFYFENSM